jgi:tRNA pseudouridine38/39 synthase
MRPAILTPSSSTPGSIETPDGSLDDPLAVLGVSTELSDDEDDGWDDIADELPYITMLNQILPTDIRILAWCPHPPPGFDARFSCRERRYRYFFTQPAFSPTPGPMGLSNSKTNSGSREGWLDIDAMREGAKHFVGSHDFRNFCKLDTSKQITNFVRTISHADIEPAPEPFSYFSLPEFSRFESVGSNSTTEIRRNEAPLEVYMFTLHGSAFLWHQVRHMVAILFLIGQGLESPSIVPDLLDVERNPRRPVYDMSSDAPLVLWDCVFPEKDGEDSDGLEWVYAGDERLLQTSSKKLTGKPAVAGILDDVWTIWRRRKIDELLAANLLDLVAKEGNRSALSRGKPEGVRHSQKLFRGGNDTKQGGTYIPLMQRSKLETVEAMNARYMAGRGSRKEYEWAKAKSSADVDVDVDE